MKALIACGALVFALNPAFGATPAEILAGYEVQAHKSNPEFSGFSADRGERLFTAKHGGEWSCATCHGANPTTTGKHARTGKTIAPLAPTANVERFTDPAKVEKWFRRNCKDVLSRECTVLERGDVVSFLVRAGK
jgi:mono/diheme cytochrome c family protein